MTGGTVKLIDSTLVPSRYGEIRNRVTANRIISLINIQTDELNRLMRGKAGDRKRKLNRKAIIII